MSVKQGPPPLPQMERPAMPVTIIEKKLYKKVPPAVVPSNIYPRSKSVSIKQQPNSGPPPVAKKRASAIPPPLPDKLKSQSISAASGTPVRHGVKKHNVVNSPHLQGKSKPASSQISEASNADKQAGQTVATGTGKAILPKEKKPSPLPVPKERSICHG